MNSLPAISCSITGTISFLFKFQSEMRNITLHLSIGVFGKTEKQDATTIFQFFFLIAYFIFLICFDKHLIENDLYIRSSIWNLSKNFELLTPSFRLLVFGLSVHRGGKWWKREKRKIYMGDEEKEKEKLNIMKENRLIGHKNIYSVGYFLG